MTRGLHGTEPADDATTNGVPTHGATARAAQTTPVPFSSSPAPLAPARWDWRAVRHVLVVRLRSIGDTVLATPALDALRRFLPDARIDLLLEDWVAPLLAGFDAVDEIITVAPGSTRARINVARRLRAARYDVAYNLHGGTTATLLVRASGARYRVGYADYQYGFLYNHLAPPSAELWQKPQTHSAEQQLALVGWTGVPVTDRPPARLVVTPAADASVGAKLRAAGHAGAQPFALVHPAAAFDSKQWAAENFARVVEHLAARGLNAVAVAAPHERQVLARLRELTNTRLVTCDDLALPELVALAARARLFVGNDSGVAHIAAAVGTPAVVVFGSSNVAHWHPWTRAPWAVVREEMPCAPCPGYTCAEFAEAQCIRRVTVARVVAAVESVLPG
ncbi:MAG TPA: glycosyltransferase family 9 protein [Pyrinomonadaceae bacterium]|jgi:lipopolysaccharide heptosyltransferase II